MWETVLIVDGAFPLAPFFLGFNTITVAVDGFDIVHAPIAYGGFFIKFASFLFLPNSSCTAAGHQSGYAIIQAITLFASLLTLL